jgi:hypothetical protein
MRKIVSRAQMQAAPVWLERQPQLGRDIFLRGGSDGHTVRRAGDITDLLRACLIALAVPERHAAALRRRPPTFWRVYPCSVIWT